MEPATYVPPPTPSNVTQNFIPLGEVAGWLRTHGLANRLHTSAPYRWCARGILLPSGQRVKLRVLRFGKRLVTTSVDLCEFAAALGAGGSFSRKRRPSTAASRTPKQRDKAVAAATKRLSAAGM